MNQPRLDLGDPEPDPPAAPPAPREPPNPFARFDNHPLPTMLDLAVPLWIMQLKERGGPTQADFDALQDAENTLAACSEYALFRSSKPGESARSFNAIAKSIATLSFCPGGISLFGRRWISQREEDA